MLANYLFLGLLIITAGDAEVSELVSVLVGGNNAEVIAELLLLEVTLGKVLELTLGEAKVGGRGDGELVLLAGDDDVVGSEGTGLTVDLDALEEETLELSALEEAVLERNGKVDSELGELLGGILAFDLKG